MAEKAYCPNCGRRAERDGKTINCEDCDAEFTIEAGAAKPKSLGRLDDHEKRLAALEAATKPAVVLETIKADDDKEDDKEDDDRDEI